MIIRNLAAVAIVATTASPAMADGLSSPYVGTGVAIGVNGQGAAATVVGRVPVPVAPIYLSLRPQVNLQTSLEGAVGATVDVPVENSTNLYVGGGVAFRDKASNGVLTRDGSTVGYAQIGVEGGLTDSIVLYGDVKVAFDTRTTVVPTVGMAYRF